MKKWTTGRAARVIAVVLFLALGAGGFWATLFTGSQWDTLWLGSTYYDSSDCWDDLSNRVLQARELARLLQAREWDGPLPYLDQRRLELLEEALSAEQTNFRFTLRRSDTGTRIYSNLEGTALLEDAVHTVNESNFSVTRNGFAADNDYTIWDSERGYYLLNVVLSDGAVQRFFPENAAQAAAYGYTYDGVDDWSYDAANDSRVTLSELVLEYGVAEPLTALDEFWDGYQDYQSYARYLPLVAVAALVLDGLSAALLVFLLRSAGRREALWTPWPPTLR